MRALENAVERAVVLCEGPAIEEGDLPFETVPESLGPLPAIPGATMAEIERHAILTTLDAVDGSTAKAAGHPRHQRAHDSAYRLNEYGARGRA